MSREQLQVSQQHVLQQRALQGEDRQDRTVVEDDKLDDASDIEFEANSGSILEE